MKQYKYPFSIITIFYNGKWVFFTLFLIRKMTYLQMNTPLISNLLTGLNILLREYIHDGKLCMLDHAVAFLSKIQHSLISIVKGWSCDLIVFLGICSIQAYGNRINILRKLRHDIPSVIEIA